MRGFSDFSGVVGSQGVFSSWVNDARARAEFFVFLAEGMLRMAF